jgi:hypothetical protein
MRRGHEGMKAGFVLCCAATQRLASGNFDGLARQTGYWAPAISPGSYGQRWRTPLGYPGTQGIGLCT